MTGMAAIAFCAAFTSCSKDENLYDPKAIEEMETAQVYEAYNKAFIATFGQVNPNQDWGFGKRAGTRANSGETYPQTEAYHNMNHNEWADPDKEFGGYTVPDPLTEEQKAVVAAYFQSVSGLTYSDPGLRHFFVQQVYKGGAGEVRNTTEGITAADGSKYNSDNMNLLSVGQANIHINDFNAGSCSTSNVLDNGQHVGGSSHTDQITLMVNIDDTSCFGYHETGSSTQHNNKAALVGWQTIHTWAQSNYSGYNGCLADNWNRSYMGFDLAIKEGAQAYATDEAGNVQYADYSQAPESPKYAWDGEKVIEIADPNKYYPIEYYDDYKTIKKGGESIGWLTTNENFYVAADKVTLSQTISLNRAQLNTMSGIQNCVVLKEVMDGNDWYQAVLNLPKIQQLVNDGYLPVKDNSLTEWVKVGKSDGYFSDWIVTLTEAKKDNTPDPQVVRIMAEDLNAEANENQGDIEDSDWDFNDVVFDVKFDKDGTGGEITLICAGGVLPLEVAGEEVHKKFDPSLKPDGKGWYPMINTGAGPNYPRVSFRVADADKANNGKGISIVVYKKNKDGEWKPYTLGATQGQPAAKFAVKNTVQPLGERVDINKASGGSFSRAVQSGQSTFDVLWW